MNESAAHHRFLAVERHIASEFARDKIAHAMYEVLVEGMEFGPCELPHAADREWIRGAMAVPLHEATDAALRALAWGISRALEGAPHGLLDRFERSHRWQELGWE